MDNNLKIKSCQKKFLCSLQFTAAFLFEEKNFSLKKFLLYDKIHEKIHGRNCLEKVFFIFCVFYFYGKCNGFCRRTRTRKSNLRGRGSGGKEKIRADSNEN